MWHEACFVTDAYQKQVLLMKIHYPWLLCLIAFSGWAQQVDPDFPGSNTNPISFGFDQRIIDIAKVHWGPLEIDGFPPGAEVAILRGSLEGGSVEVVFRLPAGYRVPNHSHTSAESYFWIEGAFTYVHRDGRAVDLSGHSYISLPGQSIHALICHQQPCMFYVRYATSFDVQVHPMPVVTKHLGVQPKP